MHVYLDKANLSSARHSGGAAEWHAAVGSDPLIAALSMAASRFGLKGVYTDAANNPIPGRVDAIVGRDDLMFGCPESSSTTCAAMSTAR
jgi:hypothetical protein